MIPLREYTENINRTWEGILDEPEKHPRFVVRPPNGLLLIWFKNDDEKYPDLKLDLSKCDCALESLEFWRRKARSGEIWQQAFSGIVKREGFNTQNSSWLLPLGLWDEVPKDINEVKVGVKPVFSNVGITFRIRHIWVDTETKIFQAVVNHTSPKQPVEAYRRMLFDLVREDWETNQWQYGLLGRFKKALNKIFNNKDDDLNHLILEIDPFYEFKKNNGTRQTVEDIDTSLQRIKNNLVNNAEVPSDARVRHIRKKGANEKLD